jgi:hypothetical protein
MSFPSHSVLLDEAYGPGVVQALLAKAHWQSAKSVEAVAPHQYVVRGWAKDDLSEVDFDLLMRVIQLHGRQEEWRAPAGFYDSGRRPKYINRYLYVGEFAYWFTKPLTGPHMLNREHLSVQQATPTRRVVEER